MTWYKAQEVKTAGVHISHNEGVFTYHQTSDVVHVHDSIAGAWEATWPRSRPRSWSLLWMGCSATQQSTGLGSVTSHKKVGVENHDEEQSILGSSWSWACVRYLYHY